MNVIPLLAPNVVGSDDRLAHKRNTQTLSPFSMFGS
jgi:hypothetical protein